VHLKQVFFNVTMHDHRGEYREQQKNICNEQAGNKKRREDLLNKKAKEKKTD